MRIFIVAAIALLLQGCSPSVQSTCEEMLELSSKSDSDVTKAVILVEELFFARSKKPPSRNMIKFYMSANEFMAYTAEDGYRREYLTECIKDFEGMLDSR